MCRLHSGLRSQGGDKGGYVVATGTPEEVVKSEESYTAEYLKEKLQVS